MRIPIAFVADEANISQEGKLNVMGVFDRIAAAEFPVMHPRMVFAFRILAEFADGGQSYPVQVRLVDESGTIHFEPPPVEVNPPILPPGEFTSANQVFTLLGMTFPHPGIYRFVVSVAGVDVNETPFIVSLVRPEPTGQLN